MSKLGYIGWSEDPSGRRLSVRGLPKYAYDPTDSIRNAERYDKALRTQIPDAVQLGGKRMQWSRPHSGPNAPSPVMGHGGIMENGLCLNEGILQPDLFSIPLPPPPQKTRQSKLSAFFLKRKRE